MVRTWWTAVGASPGSSAHVHPPNHQDSTSLALTVPRERSRRRAATPSSRALGDPLTTGARLRPSSDSTSSSRLSPVAAPSMIVGRVTMVGGVLYLGALEQHELGQERPRELRVHLSPGPLTSRGSQQQQLLGERHLLSGHAQQYCRLSTVARWGSEDRDDPQRAMAGAAAGAPIR